MPLVTRRLSNCRKRWIAGKTLNRSAPRGLVAGSLTFFKEGKVASLLFRWVPARCPRRRLRRRDDRDPPSHHRLKQELTSGRPRGIASPFFNLILEIMHQLLWQRPSLIIFTITAPPLPHRKAAHRDYPSPRCPRRLEVGRHLTGEQVRQLFMEGSRWARRQTRHLTWSGSCQFSTGCLPEKQF